MESLPDGHKLLSVLSHDDNLFLAKKVCEDLDYVVDADKVEEDVEEAITDVG